ncbi:MAG: glucose-6-phosphate dehydrogenase assembly protein OpcA [Armatimonadota bacterium]|nr:glucose-6-phosphate dehydrogenase assembly protein OpcA [bacterium]
MGVPESEIVTNPAKMEAQLASLYRRAAGVEGQEALIPVVTTKLLNLIIYASSENEAESASHDAGEIMGRHPSRTIIIDASQHAAGQTQAAISAVCGITERGERMLCGEIIELHTGGVEEDIVGWVMPLLVPDVPVCLWVIGEIPCGMREFEAAMEVSDCIIVDSRRFSDLHRGLELLIGVCTAGAPVRMVQDLSWSAIQPWRELTAQHFDPQAARGCLYNLINVNINYASGERENSPASAALLFASWLMNRLGIEPVAASFDGSSELFIDGKLGANVIRFTLSSENTGSTPGAIKSVVMQCDNDGGTASFVTRSESAGEVAVSEECRGMCYPPRVLEMPSQNEPTLVSRALEIGQRDEVHYESLGVALRILALLGD